MVDPTVVAAIRDYVKKARQVGINATRAIVYGSHARGEAKEHSDIDLIIIAEEFDGQRDRKKTALLWRLRAKSDNRIEPIGVGERQWEDETGNPILAAAKQEGLEIEISH